MCICERGRGGGERREARGEAEKGDEMRRGGGRRGMRHAGESIYCRTKTLGIKSTNPHLMALEIGGEKGWKGTLGKEVGEGDAYAG